MVVINEMDKNSVFKAVCSLKLLFGLTVSINSFKKVQVRYMLFIQ